jgi:hypothetical protein
MTLTYIYAVSPPGAAHVVEKLVGLKRAGCDGVQIGFFDFAPDTTPRPTRLLKGRIRQPPRRVPPAEFLESIKKGSRALFT